MKIPSFLSVALVIAMPSLASAGNNEAFDKSMKPVLESYLKIQEALAGDHIKGVASAARAISRDAKKLDAATISGPHTEHMRTVPESLIRAADALTKAADLETARNLFKDLSKPMAIWATLSKPHGIDLVYCSMAPGSWLQTAGSIRNPYYGAKMLTCGEVVEGDSVGGSHNEHHH